MLEVIFKAIAKLVEVAAGLVSGELTENEARAECLIVGSQITETDTDDEKAEYDKLTGDPEPPR